MLIDWNVIKINTKHEILFLIFLPPAPHNDQLTQELNIYIQELNIFLKDSTE